MTWPTHSHIIVNMSVKESNTTDIGRRLDIIVALLAAIATRDEKVTTRDKIIMLSSFGLKPSEIASILNKKSNYVSKELSIAKKGDKNGRTA